MNPQSEQINELATALAKAQGAMQNAIKNATNPHFRNKYADLASVFDAIRGPLSANGLATIQTMHTTERGMLLKTMLVHGPSGQYITSEYPLPLPGEPQKFASQLTYAKRYSLATLVCNASDEDDDGNAATAKNGNGHANGAIISEAQLVELQDLVEEVGANVELFCKYLKVGALPDLPAAKFSAAKAALEAKRAPL